MRHFALVKVSKKLPVPAAGDLYQTLAVALHDPNTLSILLYNQFFPEQVEASAGAFAAVCSLQKVVERQRGTKERDEKTGMEGQDDDNDGTVEHLCTL